MNIEKVKWQIRDRWNVFRIRSMCWSVENLKMSKKLLNGMKKEIIRLSIHRNKLLHEGYQKGFLDVRRKGR